MVTGECFVPFVMFARVEPEARSHVEVPPINPGHFKYGVFAVPIFRDQLQDGEPDPIHIGGFALLMKGNVFSGLGFKSLGECGAIRFFEKNPKHPHHSFCEWEGHKVADFRGMGDAEARRRRKLKANTPSAPVNNTDGSGMRGMISLPANAAV